MVDPTSTLDVVAVPDFSTPARTALFEARTLFFLASWLENAGGASAFPLRLACIGAPPASVRTLAAACRAEIVVCEPLGLEGGRVTANKLRGLEMPSSSGRVLMLDTDLFILGDFSALAREIPSGLAAAPAGSKWVPEALWQRIYPHLGLPVPTERAALLRAEYGLVPGGQITREEFGRTTDLRKMLPYYNSGVFLAPSGAGLREVWAEHLERLADLFLAKVPAGGERTRSPWAKLLGAWRGTQDRLAGRAEKYPRSVTTCDQASFSTALQQLRADGVPFQRLPDVYHSRRLHCQAGRLRFDEMKIYHATGFLRLGKNERWDLPRALDHGIHQWQESLRAGGRLRDAAQANNDAARAGEFLTRLYRDHVRPALAGQSRR